MIPPPEHQKSRRRPYWLILLVLGVLALLILAISSYRSGGERTNEALDAATAQARRELPTFIEALEHPTPTMRFFVRGGFGPAKAREILWVRNVSYANGSFRGTLDQEPKLYRKARKGDKVTVSPQDVFDWAIKDGDQLRGRYTEQILSH